MSGAPRVLGDVVLHGLLGEGAWGQVYAGRDLAGDPVAVKVIRQRMATPRAVEAFREEVRNAARLEHANIVQVVDYGLIPASFEAEVDAGLTPGAPYVVMELASMGSLEDLRRPARFDELDSLLLDLLAALAHAHSRGVLHRDIKPANVLLAGGSDRRPGWKLTDFGIARSLDPDGEGGLVATRGAPDAIEDRFVSAGTPRYMAPEQVQGEGRRQGPWTDLYALGCVAFELACGRAPFRGDTRALLAAHILAPAPALQPHFLCPDGFSAWVARLLCKDPYARFTSAAQAARALRSLKAEAPGAAPDEGFDTHAPATGTGWGMNPTVDLDTGGPLLDAGGSTGPTPKLPASPRPGPRATPALAALRPPPLVGRLRERHTLWTALDEVERSQVPRLVLLRGPAGVGKTRLAQWLLEQALELGRARVLRAAHAAVPGPAHGLVRMVARDLGAIGLEGRALVEHFEGLPPTWVGDETEQAPLRRLLSPGPEVVAPRAADQLVLGHVRRRARDLPLVLLLDDLAYGIEALRLCRAILDQPGLPVFVVATVNDEVLAPDEGGLEGARLAELEAHSHGRVLRLGPLSPDDGAALARAVVALTPGAAAGVAERAGGNPLFIVELLRDWVQRDLLERSEQGWAPRPDLLGLPESLQGVWLRRLRAALGDSDWSALVVGAALGRDVDAREWRAACSALGVDLGEGLLDGLARRGLIEVDAHGWRFAHGLLAESLLVARPSLTQRVHLSCAAALSAFQGTSARVGRHLLLAGETARAVGPLLDGIEHALASDRLSEVQALCDALRGAGAALDPQDQLRMDFALQSALHQLGRFEEADALAGQLAKVARRSRDRASESRALRTRGMLAEKAGDLDLAEALFMQARRVAASGLSVVQEVAALEHLGTLARLRGDLQGSVDYLQEAAHRCRGPSLDSRRADCLKELGGTLVTAERLDEAEAPLREAVEIYSRLGRPGGKAHCANNLGELCRRRGDLAGAARAYRDALDALEELGSSDRVVPMLNLGLTLLAQGDLAGADVAIARAVSTANGAGRRLVAVFGGVAALASASLAGRWEEVDRLGASALDGVRDMGLVDPEIADLAARTAHRLVLAGERERAEPVLAFAKEQLEALGRYEDLDALVAALARP